MDLLATLDHAAVDDARDDGRQLPGCDRHHRLVQEREPVVDHAPADPRPALCVQREGEQVGVDEALGDRDGLGSGGVCGLELASGLLPHHHGQQEIPALDAVALALDDPPRAPEPATGRAELATEREADADPDGAPRGPAHLGVVEVCRVRSLEGALERLVPAEHVCGRREPLEVVRGQPSTLVGFGEGRERLEPRTLGERLSTPLEHAGRPARGHREPPGGSPVGARVRARSSRIAPA